jgi:hypothetical protein
MRAAEDQCLIHFSKSPTKKSSTARISAFGNSSLFLLLTLFFEWLAAFRIHAPQSY